MEQTPRQGPPEKDDFENFWLPDQPASTTLPEGRLPDGRLPEAPPHGPVDHRPFDRRPSPRKRLVVCVALFVATWISTFFAGMALGGGMLEIPVYAEYSRRQNGSVDWAGMVRDGLIFSSCLMSILVAHEGGHWFMARRHGVPATFPFFIPFPISPFGTMGAVILQDGRRADRRALFDIAIAGPLAGLVLALPFAWFGALQTKVGFVPPGAPRWGDPLVLRWMYELVHGTIGPNQDVGLNAMLFAGWVGVFITALNLMPIGQLDGGHILYTLIGKKSHYVASALLLGGVALMIWFQTPSYAVMALLIFLTGTRHPPTANDRVPIGAIRYVLGWLTLAFIVIGFTPRPMIVG